MVDIRAVFTFSGDIRNPDDDTHEDYKTACKIFRDAIDGKVTGRTVPETFDYEEDGIETYVQLFASSSDPKDVVEKFLAEAKGYSAELREANAEGEVKIVIIHPAVNKL